jgi:tetratricopeptide (TPR) repeat protein
VESGIGAWKELQESLEKVIEICNRLGNNRQAGEAISFLTSNATIEGNLPLTEHYNARLLENAMRRNNPVQMVWHYEWAGSSALRRGEWDQALEIAERALNLMVKAPVGEVAEFIIYGIQVEAEWRKGKQASALQLAKKLLERAVKMQVVDYSIYVGFFHFMDVIFMALEQAYEQNHAQTEKNELMKHAKLAWKIMKAYARVFTVGEPVVHRYQGWIEWYAGYGEKARQSWGLAGETAASIPMHYEEGLAYLALAAHLPANHPERTASLTKAREAFARGGLDYWVEIASKA